MAKQLITESDVRALARGAEIVLGPDVIATPAALDLAFERGLRVVPVSGGGAKSACCGSGGACGCGGDQPGGCTWKKMCASDATYVVVVAHGRAVVTRLTPGGPVPLA